MTQADPSTLQDQSVGEAFAAVGATYLGDVEDPNAVYRELRRSAPVMEGDILARFGVPSAAGYAADRPVYSLFRYDDVMRVLRDAASFNSSLMMEGLGPLLGGFMLTAMDGEAHRRARGLLQPAFAPAVIDGWRTSIVDPVVRDRFVAPLVPRGRAELIGDMALGFPVSVIYAILGFPDDRQASEQFAAWALKILSAGHRDPAKAVDARRAAMEASQELYDHVHEIVVRRRAQGGEGDDLMARLIRAEFEGRSLDDDEVTNFVRMMLPAAAETTTRTFGSLMALLLERPDLLERVRRDRSLISRAIDETVRYEPVATYKARLAAVDVELGGVKIPKGSALSLCVASANRDEAAFEDSETFDIDRRPKPAFGFGFGPHMCLGLFVAKAEIVSAVNAMLDLMPNLRLDPDQPPPAIRGVAMRGPATVHVAWG